MKSSAAEIQFWKGGIMKVVVMRFILTAVIVVGPVFIPSASDVRAGKILQGPAIQFTKVPPPGGGPDRRETIAGVVSGVNVKECDCRIVLYSFADDQYWVQPFADNPYTELRSDNGFEADIHLGTAYFALLVKKSFRPAAKLAKLPDIGPEVMVIASATS